MEAFSKISISKAKKCLNVNPHFGASRQASDEPLAERINNIVELVKVVERSK